MQPIIDELVQDEVNEMGYINSIEEARKFADAVNIVLRSHCSRQELQDVLDLIHRLDKSSSYIGRNPFNHKTISPEIEKLLRHQIDIYDAGGEVNVRIHACDGPTMSLESSV